MQWKRGHIAEDKYKSADMKEEKSVQPNQKLRWNKHAAKPIKG